MRVFTVLILFLVSIGSKAQQIEDSITRILLVPFERFEFHSEFDTEELNEVNGLSGDLFYNELLERFTAAFTMQEIEGIEYELISALDWQKFKQKSNYEYIGGQSHYNCDLKDFPKDAYQHLLDGYNASKLLVITWYRIEEDKTKVKEGKVKRQGFFSKHIVDLDAFDYDQNKLFYEANKKFTAVKTLQSLSRKGLFLDDLRPSYDQLCKELSYRFLENAK